MMLRLRVIACTHSTEGTQHAIAFQLPTNRNDPNAMQNRKSNYWFKSNKSNEMKVNENVKLLFSSVSTATDSPVWNVRSRHNRRDLHLFQTLILDCLDRPMVRFSFECMTCHPLVHHRIRAAYPCANRCSPCPNHRISFVRVFHSCASTPSKRLKKI